MCRRDDTYHVPCGHWGDKTNSSPCAVGLSNTTLLKLGCHNSVTEGCIRVDVLCRGCKFKQEERSKTLEPALTEPVTQREADRKRLLEIEAKCKRLRDDKNRRRGP